MEVAYSCETLKPTYQTTQCHNRDHHMNQHLKFHVLSDVCVVGLLVELLSYIVYPVM
jgi:hypothetical protein